MKLDFQWPAAVVFSVAFVTLGARVFLGQMPHEALAALLTWLIPSPFQSTPKAKESSS